MRHSFYIIISYLLLLRIIIIIMPFYPLEAFVTTLHHSFSGQVSCMSSALALADIVREARWWISPGASSCPWGAVAFFILLSCIIGFCCGLVVATCILSHWCQRFGLLLARVLSGYCASNVVSVRDRLAGYTRRDL